MPLLDANSVVGPLTTLSDSMNSNLGVSEIRVHSPACASSRASSPWMGAGTLLVAPEGLYERSNLDVGLSKPTSPACATRHIPITSNCTQAPWKTDVPIPRFIGRPSFGASGNWGRSPATERIFTPQCACNLSTRLGISCQSFTVLVEPPNELVLFMGPYSESALFGPAQVASRQSRFAPKKNGKVPLLRG